ncbi:ABC transporter substrate-binding protein [Paenibacillus sp. GCM10027626]|uniref:ABC transporter substrate-binding protein n=1 Tax=Paenibacillus sp. GCM10027626 TaxID=3273411 RepID=UPI00363FE6D4
MKVNILKLPVMSASLAFLLLASSGCSTSTNSQDTPQAANNPIKLQILSVEQTEKPEGPAEKALADAYVAQHPNIKIEFIAVPYNDLYKKVTALATGGDMPDAFFNTPEFMRNANKMDITTDLTGLLNKDYLAEFYPNMINEASIDGQLQFLPWFATPQALIYRGDWFEKEGLQAPETWDDFLKVAQKLTKDTNGDGTVDQWGFGMIGTRNSSGAARFIPFLRTFGVEEIKQDQNGKWLTELDKPQAKEAFQFFADLNNKYGVVPPGVLETGFPEVATMMANNKIAMMISGPNAIGTITSQNPDLKGKLYSAPLPKKENHSATFGLFGYSISKSSKHKNEMADFLKFLVNKENSLKFNAISGRLPTKIEVGKDQQLSSPDFAGFVKAIDYAFPAPAFDAYSQFNDIVTEAYQLMISKSATTDDAVGKAVNRANELIAKQK